MAESFAHDLDGYSGAQGRCGVAVPDVMQSDRWQFGGDGVGYEPVADGIRARSRARSDLLCAELQQRLAEVVHFLLRRPNQNINYVTALRPSTSLRGLVYPVIGVSGVVDQ
jgi:hypothetical protein